VSDATPAQLTHNSMN